MSDSAAETPAHGPWGAVDPNSDVPDAEARRTHPLTVLTGFLSSLPQLVYAVPALFFARDGMGPWLFAIVPLILLIPLAINWLSWRHLRYRVGAQDIRVEQGLLSRKSRSIPFERVQDVGIERKPIARLLGLASVKVETGGGAGEDAELSYLKLTDAEALRDLIRDRKHGSVDVSPVATPSVTTDGVGDSRETLLFAMDNRRLLLAGLFNFSLVVIGIIGAFLQQFGNFLPFDIYDARFWLGMVSDVDIDTIQSLGIAAQVVAALGGLVMLVALGIVSGIVRTVLRDYGFRLDRVAAGFRRRRGLLTLTDMVLPAHRVQAGLVLSGPVRRRFGWRELKFQSLAQDSDAGSDHHVAPLARRHEIDTILAEAGLENTAAPASFRRSRMGPFLLLWSILALPLCVAGAVLLFMVPLAAPLPFAAAALLPLLAWLRWKHHLHAERNGQLYVQTGWWRQRLTLLPMVKTQSIDLTYSPIDRLFGTAGLVFGVAGGSGGFPLQLRALPEAQAIALRDRIMAAVAQVDFSELNEAA